MRELEFKYDVALDPYEDIDGYRSGIAYKKILAETVRAPSNHPIYINCNLEELLRENYIATSGLMLYNYNREELGLLFRLVQPQGRRHNIVYSCIRRTTMTKIVRCQDIFIQARPWMVVTTTKLVMRGANRRGNAIRNAFLYPREEQYGYDPGSPPEGADLEALEGLDHFG